VVSSLTGQSSNWLTKATISGLLADKSSSTAVDSHLAEADGYVYNFEELAKKAVSKSYKLVREDKFDIEHHFDHLENESKINRAYWISIYAAITLSLVGFLVSSICIIVYRIYRFRKTKRRPIYTNPDSVYQSTVEPVLIPPEAEQEKTYSTCSGCGLVIIPLQTEIVSNEQEIILEENTLNRLKTQSVDKPKELKKRPVKKSVKPQTELINSERDRLEV
jgi:hypothetical protein